MMSEYHAALRQKIEERIRRVDLGYYINGDPSECWVWEHRKNRNGYGRISIRGTERVAHRVSFMLWGGVLFSEDRLDHLCRNRDCVNPEHLEPVTVRENTRRGVRARLNSNGNGKPLDLPGPLPKVPKGGVAKTKTKTKTKATGSNGAANGAQIDPTQSRKSAGSTNGASHTYDDIPF